MDDALLLMTLGKKIRSIRLTKDMTQSQLSLNCNFEKSTMSKIEAGKLNLRYITLFRISQGLGIELKNLVP